MTDNRKLLHDSLNDSLATLWCKLRAALSTPFVTKDMSTEGDRSIDPDFEGWLHNDPMVTMNPTSRYGDDATGFLAGAELRNPELSRTDD